MNTVVKFFAIIAIVFYFVAALNDPENKLMYITLGFCNFIIFKLQIIEDKIVTHEEDKQPNTSANS